MRFRLGDRNNKLDCRVALRALRNNNEEFDTIEAEVVACASTTPTSGGLNVALSVCEFAKGDACCVSTSAHTAG